MGPCTRVSPAQLRRSRTGNLRFDPWEPSCSESMTVWTRPAPWSPVDGWVWRPLSPVFCTDAGVVFSTAGSAMWGAGLLPCMERFKRLEVPL